MSNVAIEAKVVDTAHLLVGLNFCHYYVRVLLISPLFTEELVEVDGLKCTDFGGILNQLVQVPLLGHLAFLPLVGEGDAGVLASDDSLKALLFLILGGHLADVFEHLGSEARHLLQLIEAGLHLSLEVRISVQHFFHFSGRELPRIGV